MTITHIPNDVLPLNEATVDLLCKRVLSLDFGPMCLGHCPWCDQAFSERCAIQETLNELAPIT